MEKEGTSEAGPPPSPEGILAFWWWYVFWYDWKPDSHAFMECLKTCDPLSLLCELRLKDNQWQHGLVFALLTFWADVHRDERPPEFPDPRCLSAFASLVHRVLQPQNHETDNTWTYTTDILQHFFPDHFSATASDVRDMVLCFRRETPGETESIEADFVRDAMEIVEAYGPRGGAEPRER